MMEVTSLLFQYHFIPYSFECVLVITHIVGVMGPVPGVIGTLQAVETLKVSCP